MPIVNHWNYNEKSKDYMFYRGFLLHILQEIVEKLKFGTTSTITQNIIGFTGAWKTTPSSQLLILYD